MFSLIGFCMLDWLAKTHFRRALSSLSLRTMTSGACVDSGTMSELGIFHLLGPDPRSPRTEHRKQFLLEQAYHAVRIRGLLRLAFGAVPFARNCLKGIRPTQPRFELHAALVMRRVQRPARIWP